MLMKKLFLILAAAAVTMWACQKPATHTDEGGNVPEVKDEITLVSDAVVNVKYESEIITVKFTTNAAWKAEADEFIVLKDKSGDAGENIELTATVQSLEEAKVGRLGGILIKAGKAEAGVAIMQGKVFLVTPDEQEIGVAGGKAEFQVISNQEYSVTIYDGIVDPEKTAFAWAPVTFDMASGMGSLAVEANAGYDARTAYIKFTVPGIQVPVLDEETGEPTGETQDYVTRFYVNQAGHAEVAWATSLPADFDVTNIEADVNHDATSSVAVFDGKLLVSDASKIYTVNLQTGKFEGTFDAGNLPVQSITNDDAGNLLLAELGPYGSAYNVYAVRANDKNLASPVNIIHAVNETSAGSHGADKVAARGDVFGNGVITMMYGGVPQYSGISYGLYWEIKDGKAEEKEYNEWNPIVNQPKMFTMPIGEIDAENYVFYNIWLSNRAAFVPAGPSVSDGFFYCGYDDQYNLFYNNGTDWTPTITVGNWAGSYMGMETISWGGKNILAAVNMGYTFEWGAMPSSLCLVDITTPTKPEVLSSNQFGGLDDQAVTGGTESSTADIMLQIDGDSLVAYAVETSHGILMKVVYPKL